MKIRKDFVSNSSSSSFIITNPECLVGREEAGLMLQKAKYVSFKVSTDEMDEIEIENFKKKLDEFGKGLEIEEYEENEFYITLNPIDGYNLFSDWHFSDVTDEIKNKIKIFDELLCKSSEIVLNFGEAYETECEATQIATLLDYMFDANIVAEDHFDYTPIKKLGIFNKN